MLRGCDPPRADRERRRAVSRDLGCCRRARSTAIVAVGLGVAATVFLVRMYSLFQRPHHNSLFHLAGGECALGARPRLPAVHPLPLVAAPAQRTRQPGRVGRRRDLHDDRRRVRALIAAAPPRLPNYRLRAVHEEQAMFAATPVVTIRSSAEAFRLKLWDEERGALVRFPRRRTSVPLAMPSIEWAPRDSNSDLPA